MVYFLSFNLHLFLIFEFFRVFCQDSNKYDARCHTLVVIIISSALSFIEKQKVMYGMSIVSARTSKGI